MLQNFSNLLPYRDYSEHDVLNMYSLDTTGLGGKFVKFITGQNNPELGGGQYSNTNVGASYAGTYSKRYENPRKVSLATSGNTKGEVAGLMLYGTVEYSNNLQPLVLEPQLCKELGVVVSGQTTPIATAGYFRIKSDSYTNTPFPGYIGVISDVAGKVAFVPPSTAVYASGLGVCKVLSTSGSAFGGYADVQLTIQG